MDAGAVAERVVRYLDTPSVVGFEGPFLDVLEAELGALGRPIERRPGLLAARGAGPLILSVHVDRHGLVTTVDDRLQYAATNPIGAHRPLSPRLAAAVCRRFERELVVAYDPATGATLGTGTVEHGDHCGIGAGLELVAAGLPDLAPGTPVGFAPRIERDGVWLRAQLDNVLSAAIVLELVAHGHDSTVLFTCGEEAGRSWRALHTWLGGPTDRLIVMDTSPFDDGHEAERGVVVLRHADAGATFDDTRTGEVAGAAARAGVDVVWKDDVLAAAGKPLGRTELGRLIAATGATMTGTTVQIPTTDYHSNHEATTAQAIEAALRTLEHVG